MANVPNIIIVYRTSERSKKYCIKILEGIPVDDILSTSKRKPPVPFEWVLEEILVGGGEEAYKKYKKKYGIK